MRASEIVNDLYEGTLDPVAWNRAIASLSDLVRASGAVLFAFNPGTGEILRSENHRLDPALVADYNLHWVHEDIRLGYALKMPLWAPETEITLRIPQQKTACYDYLLAADSPYFMPAWLHRTAHKAVALSFQGTIRRGPFGPRDVDTYRRFLPHLSRTLEIRDRLEAVEVRASNFASVLDTATFGVIVLDACRRILETNALASMLLRDKSPLCVGREGDLKVGHGGDDRLGKWLRAQGTFSSSADALLHVPRKGKLPLSILAVRVDRAKTLWLSIDPAWILLLFDAERRLAVNQQLIAKDLGLSEREALVASLLAAGLSIGSIAARMDVTVHTVRSQVKSAFQKSGCHSQTDLVRRVLMGPGIESVTH